MFITRIIRLVVGVSLLLISISAVVYFDIWPMALSGLTTNIGLAPHSWLTVRIILISLWLPGLLCLAWGPFRKVLFHSQQSIDRLSDQIFLFYVLALAAVLRVLAIFILPLRLWIDWEAYYRLALLWATTGAYTIGAQPTAYYPPGWPFFLSRLYLVLPGNPHVGVAANIALGIGIVYLGFRITQKIWGRTPARWTAIILAIFPSQVLFVNILCSEILFTFLFLLFINLVLSQSPTRIKTYTRYFISGLFLGMATLTRSLTLVFPLVMIPFCWINPSRQTNAGLRWLVLVAGLALVTAPWTIRNYHQIGRATISTNGGIDFYAGNHKPSSEIDQLLSPARMPWDTLRNEAHLDRLGYQLGMAYIRENPAAFLVRGMQKTIFMMTSDTNPFTYELINAAKTERMTSYVWSTVIVQAYYLTFLGFVGMGIVVFIRRPCQRNSGGFLLILTICYWLAVHFVFFGIGRFHFPLVPLMAGFAGLAIADITRRSANRPSTNMI